MPFYLLQKFNLESLLLLLDASSSVAFASVNIREGVHASLFKVENALMITLHFSHSAQGIKE